MPNSGAESVAVGTLHRSSLARRTRGSIDPVEQVDDEVRDDDGDDEQGDDRLHREQVAAQHGDDEQRPMPSRS